MKSSSFITKTTCAVAAAVVLTLAACDKHPVGPTCPDPIQPEFYTSFAPVRALYSNADVALPANNKPVRAIVVSNYKNEAAGNVRVQDLYGRGINLFFGTGFSDTTLKTGTVVDLNPAGGTVSAFNGDIQIKGLTGTTALTKIRCADEVVTPRVATVREAIDSIQNWASTVVKLENVTITAGSTNSTGANFNITDATGTIVTFVRNSSGITVPTGNAQSVTGYLSIFQSGSTVTPQVILRANSDVVPGGAGSNGSGITLATSPLKFDFNGIGSGTLPNGVSVRTGARVDTIGATATLNNNVSTSLWKTFTLGFKNYASATGLAMGADSTTQVTATNRALGVRQTGTVGTGGDPGAAFVFLVANTTGKNNLKMDFHLQSLDTAATVTRTTTWAVDYGFGDNPTVFTAVPAANITGTLTTGNHVFSDNAISVTFPAAVNNQGQKLWIRIVALTPSAGSGSRGASAIDDVTFTWN